MGVHKIIAGKPIVQGGCAITPTDHVTASTADDATFIPDNVPQTDDVADTAFYTFIDTRFDSPGSGWGYEG